MPKCYDKECDNFTSEEHTYCDPCKDKYFPTRSSNSIEAIQQKIKQMAERAPRHVELSTPPQTSYPKQTIVKDHICHICSKPKKNAITVKLGYTEFYICWFHKATFEKLHGTAWVAFAISQCRVKYGKDSNGGEQSKLAG